MKGATSWGKGKRYRDKYRNEGSRQKVKKRKKKKGRKKKNGEGLSQMVKKEKFEFSIVGVK